MIARSFSFYPDFGPDPAILHTFFTHHPHNPLFLLHFLPLMIGYCIGSALFFLLQDVSSRADCP